MRRFVRHFHLLRLLLFLPVLFFSPASLSAREKKRPEKQNKPAVIPHHQDKPPGPALSPAEAMRKMKVPPGFSVELVAAEPDIVNPVAMCFDERGRIWITESLEYPRFSAGKGRDRIKVLEDTDGDGKVDQVTLFAEGLNIPSGIAVGYGGVWVANAPDILFLQDTDGDGKADRRRTVVTGFGRRDTHELPNSLVWGPDGWLYGLNGVFNHSHVRYAKANPNYRPDHPGWKFTCAMFRIHPRTWEFQVFAEGTSNPWGIAWNEDGEAFLSACVIDHLWHLTETGYYHRQGGPYPPHTWKIGSIVNHKHQKAAYCGIHYYNSDAYPPAYRGILYMGNIHGNCINADALRRDGATYRATPRPDFLTAHDAWFMPVSQKTGPDGCLYILDWYDRYHCYQDARRDPAGIDRLKGRLYRIRYQNTPRAKPFDLSKETDEQLIRRLHSGNALLRRLARRLLTERNHSCAKPQLRRLVFDASARRIARLNALWAMIGSGPLEAEFHRRLLLHADPTFRAWGVRAAGNAGSVSAELQKRIAKMARDASPIVQREVAIAVRKLRGAESVAVLSDVLAHSGTDKLLPHIVWNNLQPLLEERAAECVHQLESVDFARNPGAADMMPYLAERILARQTFEAPLIARLLQMLMRQHNPPAQQAAQQVIAVLTRRVQNREITGKNLPALKTALQPVIEKAVRSVSAGEGGRFALLLLAASLKEERALKRLGNLLTQPDVAEERRLAAARALIAVNDAVVLPAANEIFAHPADYPPTFRGRLLVELGRLRSDRLADVVLKNYHQLEPELKPRAVELLTQRVNWSKKLLAAIGEKKIPASVINLNQARRLLAFRDAELTKLVRRHWGVVRTTRDPQRAEYVARWKRFLRSHTGDPFRGEKVFHKVCGQCHKIYGKGADVGPDITRNGRNSFDQLLSNVFDPSLVIGSAYRAYTVATTQGRVLTGLLVENSPQRIVLKVQGGKRETIARDEVEFVRESKVSLMPEQLEKQLKPAEIADLFAFLTLDRPPGDPNAKQLPGVREVTPRETTDPKQFPSLVAEVLPGFSTRASGVRGVGVLKEYRGRGPVLRTHPVNRTTPCVLRGTFTLPKGKRSRLLLAVTHDRRGDWKLIVKANGSKVFETIVGPQTARTKGWAEFSVDLSRFAGQKVRLELHNHPTGWSWEHGYWQRAEIISD